MPRYDFQCQGCGDIAEHLFSMSQKPDTLACRVCGGEAVSVITELADPIVKNVAWTIPHDKRAMPVGWQHGNTDHEAQERRYAREQNDLQRRSHELKRTGGHREDMRLAGKVPRELFLARQKQFGKDYWQNEGKAALKREGLLLPGAE